MNNILSVLDNYTLDNADDIAKAMADADPQEYRQDKSL